uniref:Cytochrome P450 n=1 Tax=Mycena chlorophos TaxID=658473 RepID=A0ABQ0LXW0_MYCCL|nr:predicted protein [Mycena chlorophos]
MLAISEILVPIVVTVLAYFLYHALQVLRQNLASPLRGILPSPPIPNYVVGNFKQMAENPHMTAIWREKYGQNFIFHGLLSMNELYTSDLKALNHISAHPEIYQRGPLFRDLARRLIGEGILSAEQEQHRRHNPAFGTAQIRVITEIFVEKALELRDTWTSKITQQEKTIEVLSGLRSMTLDVIGRAGFGYEFRALDPTAGPNPLNIAFFDLFHSPKSKLYSLMRLAQSMVPLLKLVPLPGTFVLKNARLRMDNIGRQIVKESKTNLMTSTLSDGGVKSLGKQRDVLSVLLKANMALGLPESQRLTEAEVIAQIPSFFLAGHETTSTATAWAMHELSVHKQVQSRLRDELLSISTDNPTLDELNSLPFLDKVARETLRVHPPVTFIQRKAMADDVLPLSKPLLGQDGKEYPTLPLRKGQTIHMPVVAVNTSAEVWGSDASEFRPDRWDNIPEAAATVPSVWGNLFTFLAGAHNCIGFRFALAEMKVLLFTLVRAFEITAAVPESNIGPFVAGTIQRPAVLASKEEKSGLPLILTSLNVNGI